MLGVFRKVKGKIGLGFGLVFVVVCLLGVTAVMALNQADERTNTMYEKNLLGLDLLSSLNITFGRGYARLLTIHSERSPAAIEDFTNFFAVKKPENDERLAEYYPDKVIDAAEEEAAQAMLANYDVVVDKFMSYFEFLQAGDIDGAERWYDTELSKPFVARCVIWSI